MLLDLLDECGVSDIFQCGCLVAEVRDYRRYNYDPVTHTNSLQHAPYSDTRHVLLRPTMQVIRPIILVASGLITLLAY